MPQGGYPIPPAELVVGPFGGELEIFEKEQFGAFRYNPSYDFSETFYAFVAWKMIGWGTETEITKHNRDYIIRNRPEVAKYYQLEECK